MELGAFISRLAHLTGTDLERVARSVRGDGTATDEVDEWSAIFRIDDALRRTGRSRLAGLAAHDAADVVVTAAHAAHAPLAEEDLTAVARAAAAVARGIVAGPGADSSLRFLLRHWYPVLAPYPVGAQHGSGQPQLATVAG